MNNILGRVFPSLWHFQSHKEWFSSRAERAPTAKRTRRQLTNLIRVFSDIYLLLIDLSEWMEKRNSESRFVDSTVMPFRLFGRKIPFDVHRMRERNVYFITDGAWLWRHTELEICWKLNEAKTFSSFFPSPLKALCLRPSWISRWKLNYAGKVCFSEESRLTFIDE